MLYRYIEPVYRASVEGCVGIPVGSISKGADNYRRVGICGWHLSSSRLYGICVGSIWVGAAEAGDGVAAGAKV